MESKHLRFDCQYHTRRGFNTNIDNGIDVQYFFGRDLWYGCETPEQYHQLKPFMSFDKYWQVLTSIDKFWQVLTSIDKYWKLLIGIDQYW